MFWYQKFAGVETSDIRILHLTIQYYHPDLDEFKKNIGRNPIVDCERNGERQKRKEQKGIERNRKEQNRIEKNRIE